VDCIIRQSKNWARIYSKLSSFTRIKPAEYLRQIAPAVTGLGLCHDGEVIALEPENAPKLAASAEVLRRDSQSEDSSRRCSAGFAKARRAMRNSSAPDWTWMPNRSFIIPSAMESWRSQLERIQSAGSEYRQ